jgi:membrane protease YdiL (CAAX protease family)
MSHATGTDPHQVPPSGAARRRWAGMLLPGLFFGWMYGSSLLLLLGLLNQIAWMSADEHRLVGWYYVAGLVAAFTVPSAGLVLARRAGQRQWSRWFGRALGFAFIALLLVAVAWCVTGAPRYQDREPPAVEREPSNPYQDCVVISGGTNTCPGG